MLSHSDRAALIGQALHPNATDFEQCRECEGRREIHDISPDTGEWITIQCPGCAGVGYVALIDPDDLDLADAA